MNWRPLSIRSDPNAFAEYDSLHEGVPEWLRTPLKQWLFSYLQELREVSDINSALAMLYGRVRRSMPDTYDIYIIFNDLGDAVAEGDLDIVDACLAAFGSNYLVMRHANKLRDLLLAHGSIWTVGKLPVGLPCLEKRVDETTTKAAQAEMQQKGNAASHLRHAWTHVYGRSPDPSSAYREAVRAVEAAAKPIISPKDKQATLGKMISSLRDKPSKWSFVLEHDGNLDECNPVVTMLQTLWRSQHDRHGTDDANSQPHVNPNEAEAAVHLAITLVHWFRTGVITQTN